jgi:hypothetical protein
VSGSDKAIIVLKAFFGNILLTILKWSGVTTAEIVGDILSKGLYILKLILYAKPLFPILSVAVKKML